MKKAAARLPAMYYAEEFVDVGNLTIPLRVLARADKVIKREGASASDKRIEKEKKT